MVPAPGGDRESSCVVPAPGGDRESSCLVPAPGGDREFSLELESDLGYRVLGPGIGSGTYGEVFPALWKNGMTEAGGLLVAVKHVAIEKPHESIAEREAREVHVCRQIIRMS